MLLDGIVGIINIIAIKMSIKFREEILRQEKRLVGGVLLVSFGC